MPVKHDARMGASVPFIVYTPWDELVEVVMKKSVLLDAECSKLFVIYLAGSAIR
jgi:hypothetical protein